MQAVLNIYLRLHGWKYGMLKPKHLGFEDGGLRLICFDVVPYQMSASTS